MGREKEKLFHTALEFAAKAHQNQMRKLSDTPYIVHPVETAWILFKESAPFPLQIAALLHDTLEDTNTTPQDIEALFGKEILALVQACSEDKKKSWEERKTHTIAFIKTAPEDVKMLCLADKLSNLRSIASDYPKLGESLWQRFHRGKDQQKWYYKELLLSLSSLKHKKMYQEALSLYQTIFE